MATPDEARQAADRHADDLSARPNVVGIGTRPVDEATGADHAVAVYVSRKVPAEALRPDERLPATVDLTTGRGTTQVPVVVVEIGPVQPEADDSFSSE